MLKVLCLFVTVSVTTLASAYTGDYVWDEKFQKNILWAQEGKTNAQYRVADMYERGRGTAQDLDKAFDWYLKAANKGHKKAAFRAGLAYLKGKGVEKDEKQALYWLQTAAGKGYERAQYYLAEMYETGTEVHQDLEEALKLYIQSRDGGYAPAISSVERISNALNEQSKIVQKLPPYSGGTATNANHRKVSRTATETRRMILKGGWKKRDKDAEFLPSRVTKCKATGPSIECISKKQNRNIGSTNITYTTKAILYGIKDTGEFKISYRNNVLNIKSSNKEEKPIISTGWQDTEHVMVCQLKTPKDLNCIKNKVRKVRLKR